MMRIRTSTPCTDWQNTMGQYAPQPLINAMAGLGTPQRVIDVALDPHLGEYLRLIVGIWKVNDDVQFHGIVHIKDKGVDPSNNNFRIAWHAYLRFHNLFQFVPGIFFLTETGAFTENFDHLIENVYRDNSNDSYPKEWKALLDDEIFEEYHDLLRKMFALGIPIPNMEPEDLEQDGIETEIPEMLWEEQHVVLFCKDSDETLLI